MRREVEDELVAVVQEAVAVDRLVVADRQIAGQAGGGAGRRPIDGDRLDPVDDVLQPAGAGGRPATTSSAVHGSLGFAPTFRNSDPSGRSTRVAAATQVSVHSRYSAARQGVLVAAVLDADVVRRRGDDDVDAVRLELLEDVEAVGEIEAALGLAGLQNLVRLEND